VRFTHLVAWRFMLKGTPAGTFSPMTLFAWLAIGVGVAAMSCLLSVMYGFESALRERVLKAYPHVMIRPVAASQPLRDYEPWTEKFKALPIIARTMPYLETEMILQSDHRTLGGVIWGLPPDELQRLEEGITEGALPNPESKLPQVILGSELGHRLGVSPGSRLKLISPIETGGAMGMVPKSQVFEVAGLYASGHYEFDQQYLFLALADGQELLRWGDAISGWHLWADDLEDSEKLLQAVQAILPSTLEAKSWREFNSALFQSLKLEQYSMFTILSFAILIAVMNIVITLMMHVTHKRANIGILRALGASKKQIRQAFLWQGAFLGGVGLALGAVLTAGFIVYVRYFSTYLLPEIYYDRSIPIELRPLSLGLIYTVAIILIYLATLYPAKRAAALHPIDAIRE